MHAAIENLRGCQRQLDMDGCEVGVSRQAVDETLEITAVLFSALRRLVGNKAAFDRSSGNQADAYYCLVKGCDADWKAALAAIEKAEDGA